MKNLAEEVKKKADIVDIIGQYVKLRKSGNNFVGLCPFHSEKEGSFTVSPEKQSWHCFGACNTGGDVIAFIEKVESLDFKAAVGFLAEKLGIPVNIWDREIAAVYDYGKFEVVRTDPKGFYQRRADGAGGYINNLKGVKPCLYHLDEVKKAIGESRTVFIAEGEKDVDNLRALGLAATCNPMGAGKWKQQYTESLEGADLVLIPDNDAPGRAHAEDVARACHESSSRVRIVPLPQGKDATEWLNNGGTIDKLMDLVAAAPDFELKKTPDAVSLSKESGGMFDIVNGELIYNKPSRDGTTETTLCNFTLKITADIFKDNGIDVERFLRVRGLKSDGKVLPEVEIPESSFNSMNWVREKWGARLMVWPGQLVKDLIRFAAEIGSKDMEDYMIFTHMGWREIDGKMVYLTAAGGLGVEGVMTDLDQHFRQYALPEPEVSAKEAFHGSLGFLDISNTHRVTLPIWAGMYLAPLSDFIDSAFTIWYEGLSGSFKSTVTALALSHYGYFDENSLPISWSSTANSLGRFLFIAKNAPLIIDDWAPGADQSKQGELNKKAEEVIRNQANRQGRSRMRSDSSFQATYVPRGLLISSGEHTPGGYSAGARVYAVHIDKDNISKDMLNIERDNRHLYQQSMSHYVKWVGSHWDELKKTLPDQFREWRDKADTKDIHPRMPGCVAWLYTGLYTALQFAVDIGALKQSTIDDMLEEGWHIFYDLAVEQGGRVDEERPGWKFSNALQALISSGRVVLQDKDEISPREPGPGKILLGYHNRKNGHIFLHPDNSYKEVYEYLNRSGEPFNLRKSAVWNDLKKLGVIEVTGNNTTRSVWIPALGMTARFLEFKKEALGFIPEYTEEPML